MDHVLGDMDLMGENGGLWHGLHKLDGDRNTSIIALEWKDSVRITWKHGQNKYILARGLPKCPHSQGFVS